MKKIPTRFIVVTGGKGTVAIRGNHGRFQGRRISTKNDGTKNIRVKQDVDVNGDGKVDFFGGEILGRTKVAGSSRSRAHLRRL